ncbi:hypothetical protein M3Y97_00625300 [Aphelenchoides bicaudatus]|nr:hypothetical protein M3Y97_00625300 [Aphelenchoides bicaudatus]
MRLLVVSLFLFQLVDGLTLVPFEESRIYELQQSAADFEAFQKLAASVSGYGQLTFRPGAGYTTNVAVGASGQIFKLLVDLEELENLVPYPKPGKTWTIDNGEQDSVLGSYGKDMFFFGDQFDVPVASAEFGLVSQFSLSYTQWPADGVLGLAKQISSDPTDSPPVLSDIKLFQLYLQDCSQLKYCGSVAFGKELLSGGDLNICNASDTVKFTSNFNDWGFKVSAFEIAGQAGLSGSWQVSLNPYAAMIKITTDLFKSIVSTVSGKFDDNTLLYMVDCSVKITVKFGVDQAHYLLLKENVLVQQLADGTCYLRAEEMAHNGDGSPNDIVLGKPLFTHYCQTFNLTDGTVAFQTLIQKTKK